MVFFYFIFYGQYELYLYEHPDRILLLPLMCSHFLTLAYPLVM